MGAYRILEQKLESVLTKRERISLSNARKQADLADRAAAGKLSAEAYEREAAFLETESTLEWSAEEKALLSIAEGKKPLKVHVHKTDDAMYLIDLCRRFPLQVSAEHLMDVNNIETFRALQKAGIPAVYGPLGSHPYKTELKNAGWKNAAVIMKSGIKFGLMTDHPVILSHTLRECLKYFLVSGMSDAKAIELITSVNADILGIGDRLGRIQSGYLASFIVWNNHPLHLAAFPKRIVAEGKIIR
jgi:imidazolonepropionase-like amidohydrolase